VIARQLTLLTRLVDDLLDVSRITRGKINVKFERTDLRRVVTLGVETSRSLIAAGGHALSVDLPPTALDVHGDAVRLAQVVSNLLNNAAKHSGAETSIRLAVRREGEEAVLSVSDSGVGIPEGMHERIFEPFMQLAASPDRAQGGLGMGLTLVRSLVEIHQGRVEARSAGEGRGSEFVVRLPALPAADEPSPKVQVGPRPLETPARRRILVVDDNVDAAQTLGRMLQLDAHKVEVVHDGPSALLAAERANPEIVLLDLGLPEMDGFEVARRLRERPVLSSARLIAVSGYAQPEDRRRTAEAGFDDHLIKPLDLTALQLLIDRGPKA
jgi:CheY-like chemotaxis protein